MKGPGPIVKNFCWATVTGSILGHSIVFKEHDKEWVCFFHDQSTWDKSDKLKSVGPIGYGKTLKLCAEDALEQLQKVS